MGSRITDVWNVHGDVFSIRPFLTTLHSCISLALSGIVANAVEAPRARRLHWIGCRSHDYFFQVTNRELKS
jgi:hypothetical protein